MASCETDALEPWALYSLQTSMLGDKSLVRTALKKLLTNLNLENTSWILGDKTD